MTPGGNNIRHFPPPPRNPSRYPGWRNPILIDSATSQVTGGNRLAGMIIDSQPKSFEP